MTDEVDAPAPEPTVPVSALKELMERVRPDVVGQCWTLWSGVEELVKAAV